jgi:hypothetical protein
MMRTVYIEHLALAERHIAAGRRHVTRQRQIVDELAADGHDTRLSLDLLQRFEALLALHIEDRDRLLKALAGPDR